MCFSHAILKSVISYPNSLKITNPMFAEAQVITITLYLPFIKETFPFSESDIVIIPINLLYPIYVVLDNNETDLCTY